nr:hypothetical protein [Bacillus pumilus]MDF9460583.1 hypothetical protein [Bacillus pumilus]
MKPKSRKNRRKLSSFYGSTTTTVEYWNYMTRMLSGMYTTHTGMTAVLYTILI